MRRNRGFAVSVALVVLLTAAAFAQGNNPPASTKEAGETSGHGMTMSEAGQSSGKQSGAEAQIRKLDEQMRQSALKGDASVLEKYLAPNYIAMTADGRELTRDEAIQARKTGKVKYDSIDLRDTKVRMYGNTAIVTHDGYVKGSVNGQPFNGETRATFVWVKQGGKWQVASFSAVPVQGTSSAAASPEKK
jgi:ketosteroid isomerase-like protein